MAKDVTGFLGGLSRKEPAYQCRRHRDTGLIPRLRRSPGAGNGNLLLPGESHRQRSLAGSSPWGFKESDMTEVTKCVCVHTHTHTDVTAVSVAPGAAYVFRCSAGADIMKAAATGWLNCQGF